MPPARIPRRVPSRSVTGHGYGAARSGLLAGRVLEVTVTPAPARWALSRMPFPAISAASLEQIAVTVAITPPSVNPTSDPVLFAFTPVLPSGGNPPPVPPASSSLWVTGSWQPATTITPPYPPVSVPPYTALCLAGPGGGVTLLTAGNWNVFIAIQDNPEFIRKFAGVQQVY